VTASAVPSTSPPLTPGAAPQLDDLRVALVGNPNTGKTALFNALTGMRQRVGNFAGVTVERVEGSYVAEDGRTVRVLDLPGSYSLNANSPDEAIALDALLNRVPGMRAPDVAVVVVDAQNIERNLFLASQLLDLGVPTVVALNQMDAAESDGIRIDVVELISELGVTVIPTVATRGDGVDRLRRAISRATSFPAPERKFRVPAVVQDALAPLQHELERTGLPPGVASMEAMLHLSTEHGDHGPTVDAEIHRAKSRLRDAGFHPESIEAELRYGWISGVVERTVSRPSTHRRTTSDRVDSVLLHRVWGPLIFIGLMAVVFQSVFSWAIPFADLIESTLGFLGGLIGQALPDGDLNSLLVDGLIGGVGSVLVFLPQIAILFLFIGILEDSGYMARAAFIMDRYMRKVGLHGRSFIPLLSGYACAVPAIMSTRTIEQPKDRLATIMIVPLMSCSARLPVYTLLIGAFVPSVAVAGFFDLKGVALLGMYLLGTVTAMVVALIFRRTLLRGRVQPLILELPPYRVPSLRSLLTTVWHRVSVFLRRAGTIILAAALVLWALATYPKTEVAEGTPEATAQEQQLSNSALGRIGHAIEPAVRPLGFDWKMGVSIVSSFAAREVFVSTMGTIYGIGSERAEEGTALAERLQAERNPVTGQPVYTTLTALGLLVFYVYALMCMSTVAVTVREAGGGRLGWRWAGLQFGYMLLLAYGAAWLVRVVGTALGYA
jgi:ferrous iron transport protein B